MNNLETAEFTLTSQICEPPKNFTLKLSHHINTNHTNGLFLQRNEIAVK